MDIEQSLFEGESICLAPIDYEGDAAIESKWTHDEGYLRLLSSDPALPLSPEQVKKKYEQIEKQIAEDKDGFYFTIRMREDDRLIGFAEITWVEWTHGDAGVRIGIGAADDRRQGYGTQALNLLLGFAFRELNLFRLTAIVAEYNHSSRQLFGKAGFIEEVRRRQALNRDGRRWDLIYLGLLQQDWHLLSI